MHVKTLLIFFKRRLHQNNLPQRNLLSNLWNIEVSEIKLTFFNKYKEASICADYVF